MCINIIKPGLLTTVQDQGRAGYQKDGVTVNGVMDQTASRIINMLVGNRDTDAVLEMTLKGAKISFQKDALIAIGGGDMSPSIDGYPVRSYRPVFVQEGSVLDFGNVQQGCRVYLAVAGGFQVPLVMGSSSTYLRAGFGGLQGRSLKKDDALSFGSPSSRSKEISSQIRKQAGCTDGFYEMNWYISPRLLPKLSGNPVVRAFKGRQYGWFTQESCQQFFLETFAVTTQADRMGYRLEGPDLELMNHQDLLSEAVANGTIQITSDGTPIILLADRQTTGGYPKIAQIATVDLPILAQLKPGDTLKFKEISHDESQKLLVNRERELNRLKQGIDSKMNREA